MTNDTGAQGRTLADDALDTFRVLWLDDGIRSRFNDAFREEVEAAFVTLQAALSSPPRVDVEALEWALENLSPWYVAGFRGIEGRRCKWCSAPAPSPDRERDPDVHDHACQWARFARLASPAPSAAEPMDGDDDPGSNSGVPRPRRKRKASAAMDIQIPTVTPTNDNASAAEPMATPVAPGEAGLCRDRNGHVWDWGEAPSEADDDRFTEDAVREADAEERASAADIHRIGYDKDADKWRVSEQRISEGAEALWIQLYWAICDDAMTSPPFTVDGDDPETSKVSEAMNALHEHYGGHPAQAEEMRFRASAAFVVAQEPVRGARDALHCAISLAVAAGREDTAEVLRALYAGAAPEPRNPVKTGRQKVDIDI